jgi:hypothetical protein
MVFISFILCSPFTCHGTPPGLISPVCATYDTEHTYEGSHDLKLAIATEMLETVDWNEESQAKARQYLYDLLMQDTTLANSNSAFLDFIAEYEAVLHSAFEVYNDLRNVEQYDSLFTALIAEADSLIQIYADSIEYIFNERLEEELSEVLENLYYQINFLEQTKSNLISERQAFVEGELGEIQNDYVVSPEIPAINTQFINGVYINYLEEGENEDVIIQNYNSLILVAQQCPAAGGQSVYRARAMLALINDSLEYNDAIVCLQSGIYREAAVNNILHKIKIIPNPAQNEIEIMFEEETKAICFIRITNMLGQELIIKSFDCSRESNVIDVSSLKNGIYTVSLQVNDLFEVQKLIINK